MATYVYTSPVSIVTVVYMKKGGEREWEEDDGENDQTQASFDLPSLKSSFSFSFSTVSLALPSVYV